MNNKLSINCLILVVVTVFFACRGPVKEKIKSNASTNSASLEDIEGQKYSIVQKESVVTWKGRMSIGSNAHWGFINITEGSLVIDDGQLVGGIAKIDMNTIADESHKSNSGLIEHIKSPDFFDVKNYPTSTITFSQIASTDAENIQITGNLTVKGITHPVTFPAKMEAKDGIIKADGRLMIDRTDWDIRYNSGKFFDNLKDEAIADSIEINVKIVAKK